MDGTKQGRTIQETEAGEQSCVVVMGGWMGRLVKAVAGGVGVCVCVCVCVLMCMPRDSDQAKGSRSNSPDWWGWGSRYITRLGWNGSGID